MTQNRAKEPKVYYYTVVLGDKNVFLGILKIACLTK